MKLMLLGLAVFPLAACNNAENNQQNVNEEENVIEATNEAEEIETETEGTNKEE